MGLGNRVFVIDDKNKVHRFPYDRYCRLWDGDESAAVPEMRGRNVRFAKVDLETRDHRPKKILNILYEMIPFDKFGRIDPKIKQQRLGDAIGRRWIRVSDPAKYAEMTPPSYWWTATDDIELSIRTAIFGKRSRNTGRMRHRGNQWV